MDAKLQKELEKEREKAAKKRAEAAAKQQAREAKEAATLASRAVSKLAVLSPKLASAAKDPRCEKIPKNVADDVKRAYGTIDDMYKEALKVAAGELCIVHLKFPTPIRTHKVGMGVGML